MTDKADVGVFDEGWRFWYTPDMPDLQTLHSKRPYDYVEVEIWREGWQTSQLCDPSKLPDEMNVHRLWWRPSGPLRK